MQYYMDKIDLCTPPEKPWHSAFGCNDVDGSENHKVGAGMHAAHDVHTVQEP